MRVDREFLRAAEEKAKRRYIPKKGSWETVLAGVRDLYPEDLHVVDESDYFTKTDPEERMSMPEACFQFYLGGVNHRVLAERVVSSNRGFMTSVKLGQVSQDQRRELINTLAEHLYDFYPPGYREKNQK